MSAAHRHSTEHYETIGRADAPDWLDKRNTGIGSSDMAAVLDASPFKSAWGLYMEKTGQVPPEDLSDVERIQWGRRLETSIIEGYQARTGRRAIEAGYLLRSKRYPWALCTLDAWTIRYVGASYTPLEAKNIHFMAGERWADGAPEYYRIQGHQQLLVTGGNVVTVAALIGGQQLVWQDVERDEQLIERIIDGGESFWSRVQHRDPPRVADTKAAREDLARAYPKDDGEVLDLDEDLGAEIARLLELKAQQKDLKAEVRAAENRIKAAMGSATEGTVAGMKVTWKAHERAGYRVAPATVRQLRITTTT